MRGQVILSHGSLSSPDATKVSALAALADSMGWETRRPDYRADDALGHGASVKPRIERLREAIGDATPVLMGSSMGAFVSGLVSTDMPVAGLFLLATPAGIPGYASPFDLCDGVPTLLIHGRHDEVCPLDGAQAFAAQRRLPLLILDDDHRLGASLDAICAQFRAFLAALA